MPKSILSLIALLASCAALAACATVPRAQLVTVEQRADCVVLLHGLNRSWRAMNKMAEALQEEGFSTANVDYPSQGGTVEDLAPEVIELGVQECRSSGATNIHFVTHSMGGILLRFAQSKDPIPELGRVVMLGPPNQGSEIIDKTRNWWGAGLFSGPAGKQLGTDEDSIPSRLGPVDFELGVIAGTGTINPFMSAMLPDEDDGKVTVERTKVDGMDDFAITDDSHHYIIRSTEAIANTVAFLRTGQFLASIDSP